MPRTTRPGNVMSESQRYTAVFCLHSHEVAHKAQQEPEGDGNGGGSRSARLSVAARDLLTRLPLLSSLLEQIIQGGIHPPLHIPKPPLSTPLTHPSPIPS